MFDDIEDNLGSGEDEGKTYKIVRHYFDESHEDNRKVIRSGLTLEEAQDHCYLAETKGDGWFDAWTEE